MITPVSELPPAAAFWRILCKDYGTYNQMWEIGSCPLKQPLKCLCWSWNCDGSKLGEAMRKCSRVSEHNELSVYHMEIQYSVDINIILIIRSSR